MKQHEREFFISLIRSGKFFIYHNDLILTIVPPTIEQIFYSCKVYNDAYDQAFVDGMMSEKETDEWMIEKELWTYEDNDKIESIKKDIEKFKVQTYECRNDKKLRDHIKLYLREAERQLIINLNKKGQYYHNTCEGIASTEKLSWIIKNTTYCNNKLYDFSELSLPYIIDEFQSSFLPDHKIRELARNEPWKSLWIIHEKANIKLFGNDDNAELTNNQKNLLVWSQMYDNIQESLDCPPKDVIDDDDMLDGWFIIQSKKRDKERAEQEFANTTSNQKIKNSSEIYLMSRSPEDKKRIESMNNIHSTMIKKQREQQINLKGSINQAEFIDEKLNINMKSTQQFRTHLGGT